MPNTLVFIQIMDHHENELKLYAELFDNGMNTVEGIAYPNKTYLDKQAVAAQTPLATSQKRQRKQDQAARAQGPQKTAFERETPYEVSAISAMTQLVAQLWRDQQEELRKTFEPVGATPRSKRRTRRRAQTNTG